MLAVVVAVLVFLLVVEPFLVALHELGHAVVPLALGRETAVFVGGDRGPTVTLGALTLTVAPRGLLSPVTDGATVTDVQTGRWAMLSGTLAGPVTSLFATIAAWIALQSTPVASSAVLWWLTLFAVCYGGLQTLSTLAPIEASVAANDEGSVPFRTDGRIALALLLGRDPVLDGDGGRLGGDE